LRELWNNADFTATFEVIARALLFYDEVHNEYKLIDAVKVIFDCKN
jgi:predicted AAA+ superfamily ATPase